nr:putative movment protein [Solemoviridae sp.]
MSTEIAFALQGTGDCVYVKVWATTHDGVSISADEACFDAIWDHDSSIEECVTINCTGCRLQAFTVVTARNLRLVDDEEDLEISGLCEHCEYGNTDLYEPSESDESVDPADPDEVHNLLVEFGQLLRSLGQRRSEINLSGPEDSDSSADL